MTLKIHICVTHKKTRIIPMNLAQNQKMDLQVTIWLSHLAWILLCRAQDRPGNVKAMETKFLKGSGPSICYRYSCKATRWAKEG